MIGDRLDTDILFGNNDCPELAFFSDVNLFSL